MANGRTAGIIALIAGVGGGAVALWYFLTKKSVTAPPGAPPPGAPPPPGPPMVQVTATGPNTAEATVSWSPVSGATYYKVYVDGTEVLSNVQGTTARLTNLVPGRTYQIAVAACN